MPQREIPASEPENPNSCQGTAFTGLQLGAESISKRLEAATPVHRAISHCPSPHPEAAAGVGPMWLLVLVSAELCQLLSAEFLAPRADCLIANRVFWEISGGV